LPRESSGQSGTEKGLICTYGVALAAAVLSADRKVRPGRLEKTVLPGELALDGRVRPVRGVLPAVIAAKREGWPFWVGQPAQLSWYRLASLHS
jgi:magnesium chelatase family protein